MKTNYSSWSKIILAIAFGFCLAACITANDSPLSESEYSTKIIGSWEGTAGNLKETMSLNRDSTFICRVSSMGFLANTLSQTQPGKILGNWQIKGAQITMKVNIEKNEHLENSIATSTILEFNQDSLVLKSKNGDISSFKRTIIL